MGFSMSPYRENHDIIWNASVPQVMPVSFNFSSPVRFKINTNQSSDCSIVLCNNAAPLLTRATGITHACGNARL